MLSELENGLSSISPESFLAPYESLSLATCEDDQAIKEFLSRVPMEAGKIAVRYTYHASYSGYTGSVSTLSYTVLIRDLTGEILGMGTLGVRRVFYSGRWAQALYLSDLRFTPKMSRKHHLRWRSFYRNLIENFKSIKGLENCEFIYSIVLDKNQRALNSFLGKRYPVKYNPVTSFRSVQILGAINPFKRKSRYEAKREILTPELENYLISQFRLCDFVETSESKSQEYLVVRESNKILASACLSRNGMRRTYIESLHWTYKLLFKLLKVFGRQPIRANQEIQQLYFNEIEIDQSLSQSVRCELFHSLVSEALKNLKDTDQLLSLVDFDHDSFKVVLAKNFVFNSVSSHIYIVTSKPLASSKLKCKFDLSFA